MNADQLRAVVGTGPLYRIVRRVGRLLVMLNPFSTRRKRDPEYFFARYTKDAVERADTEVGDYSYGKPVSFLKKEGN